MGDVGSLNEDAVMTLKTEIPDNSIAASRLGLLEQKIVIKYEELQKYFEFMREQPYEKILKMACALTIRNLSPDNSELWDTISQSGETLSLSQSIDRKLCTCFHRSIFFNLLMQQVKMESLTLQGRVIETDISKLSQPAKQAPFFNESLLGLNEGDFVDYHLWNIISYEGRYYLIDTAFLVNGEPLMAEIEFDNEARNTFTVKLPNGRYRHYLSSGTLETQS